MFRKVARFVLLSGVIVGLLGAISATVVGFYFYFRFTRDLPQIESLKDYRPKAVTSIYSSDGVLLAEAFDESGRRYPVEFRNIPLLVRNAFLAAEDASFYTHPGIDPISILRAVYKNLLKQKARQGASTITQQTVKSLLLTREKSMERKVKEAILSYRLEKYLTKDEIFAIYLNEIYLGSGASGVLAASRVHFHKNLDELTVGEAAYLAGLPQRPSELANPKNRRVALERQRYVVDQMLKNKMITPEQAATAKQEKLTIYLPDEQTIFAAPYFSSYVINSVLPSIFESIDRYSSATNPGGYRVYTSVSVKDNNLATLALQKGLREVDKRQGWRGPLVKRIKEAAVVAGDKSQPKNGDKSPTKSSEEPAKEEIPEPQILSPKDLKPQTVYKAAVQQIGPEAGKLLLRIGGIEGKLDLKKAEWARRFRKGDAVTGVEPARIIKVGDIVEVSLDDSAIENSAIENSAIENSAIENSAIEKSADGKGVAEQPAKDATSKASKESQLAKGDGIVPLKLDQSPELEAAFFAADPLTGEIRAMVGGYDFRRNQFNRVTQARRQPGSSFKPFVYLAALERLGYTPSTMVPDSPISLVAGDGKLWTPGNFDGEFLGPITLRTALQRSRNVVSVYMIQQLGVHRVIEVARRFGITTPVPPNLSIALGSAEVEMLELVRAYGVFASGGWLADALSIKRIEDRDGHVIYEQYPRGHRVIDEDDAYIMASMMKGVVDRGTATVMKSLNRPLAGKTGTTNDQMDAWFIGYTPEYVGGAWVGYDVKRTIGKMETGGKAAAPIMLHFLKDYLKDQPPLDFAPSDGVVPVPVDLASGHVVSASSPGAFLEYFKSGTEPTGYNNTLDDEEGEDSEGDDSDENEADSSADETEDSAPNSDEF